MSATADAQPAPGQAGRWATREVSWYSADYLYCTACGAMLHREYWLSGRDGSSPYCSPECEKLEARVAALYASMAASCDDQDLRA